MTEVPTRLERTDRTDPVQFVDERLGVAAPVKKALRYVFPDHWSFLLGEMSLYAFVVLIGTGIPLALFYDPSDTPKVWEGPYAPLSGQSVSTAYASALDLSFKVPGGLLLRQTHHWAANLFLVAITIHLLRVAFTGAFRKPRELNYLVGALLLGIALVEGFLGYSLLDDLLSGSGLAIAYSVVLSIPGLGGALGALFWDGPYPGGPTFFPRMYIVHVLVIPGVMAGLIAAHLALIIRPRHTQFRGKGRKESNVVGSPLWIAYSLRALGWLVATAAMLVLLGGLVQINPIWQWGPYEPYLGENGAQPDWYLGWLIGALRLMPNWEVHLFGRTLIPNPFFGGLLFPSAIFGLVFAFPWIDRKLFTRDTRKHHLLDRPRDNPRRSGVIVAVMAVIFVVWGFGAADQYFLNLSISYQEQLWIWRGLLVVLPPVAYALTVVWCARLRERDQHPLREVEARLVRRPRTAEDVPASAEEQEPAAR